MRLRSLVIAGAAAIVALGIVAVLAIALLDRGRVAVRDARPSAPSSEPGPPAAPLAAERARSAPEPLSVARSVGPPSQPWSAVPISARPSQLGAEVAVPIQRGLEAARDLMEPCFDSEARRARATPSPAAQPGFGSPILTLSLETGAGTIAVIDAEVDSLGHATLELVACCKQVLQGYVMRAPEAPPGERYRLRYVLQ